MGSAESLPHLVDHKTLLFDCGGGPFIACWRDALLGAEPTMNQNLNQRLASVVMSIISIIALFARAGPSRPNISRKISHCPVLIHSNEGIQDRTYVLHPPPLASYMVHPWSSLVKTWLFVLSLSTELSPRHLSLSQFRSLLLVLVLALTVRSSPRGRLVHPQPSKDGGSVRLSEDCPYRKNLKFPTMVKVDIRISNSDHAFRMVHDVRNRSLAPWDYR